MHNYAVIILENEQLWIQYIKSTALFYGLLLLYTVDTTPCVSQIKLPAKIQKRGRPKGSEVTVVGLPKRKKSKNKPTALKKKHPKDQEKSKYTTCSSSYNAPFIHILYWIG